MSLEIAITMRDVLIPEYGEERDVISRDWYQFLSECGFKPLLIPNIGGQVVSFLEGKKPCGIILTGGNNISSLLCPAGEEDEISDTSEIRDQTEIALLEMAVKSETPVLGVCRGNQVVNAFFGGRIIFNFKRKNPAALSHAGTTHEITLHDQDMARIAGVDTMLVNSYHNHAFTRDETAACMKIAATAPDGAVEAIIHERLPAAGIMWHPERKNPAHEFDVEFVKRFFHGRGK